MEDRVFRVYDFVNYSILPEKILERPRGLSLKRDLTIRPVKKTTILFGERTQSEYYESYNQETNGYENLLLRIDHVFTRDIRGLVEKRETKSCWTYDDGELEPGVTTVKFYPTEQEKYEEIKRRRYNLIYRNLIPLGILENLESEITVFFEVNQTAVSSYIDVGSREIISIVSSSSEIWLDQILETAGRSAREAIPIYLNMAIPPQ
ncbi:MAG: hypothetical protein QNJ38_01360 [Prochloraceae cyanobacterium]|nr:hypothetical protein [Prochloraceae cyanobacterium]